MQLKDRKITNISIVLWFASFFGILYFMYRTLITIDAVFHFYLLFCLLGVGAFYYFKRPLFKEKQERSLVITYSLMAIGPIFTFLLLFTNFIFAGPAYSEEYIIEDVRVSRHQKLNFKEVELNTPKHMKYEYFTYVFAIDKFERRHLKKGKNIKFDFAKGIFGFKVLLERELKSGS